MDEQENRAQDTNTQVDKVELGDNTQKLESKSKDSSGSGRPKIGDSRPAPNTPETNAQGKKKRKRRRSRSGNSGSENLANVSVELDDETLKKRRGRERKGKAVGRYTMVVHVEDNVTQIAMLEGRSLIEFYVSRPADDISEIHGNIYLGRVENVLPGMEAAFVDIGTPKNAVLYQSDLIKNASSKPNEAIRIEEALKIKSQSYVKLPRIQSHTKVQD